MTVAENAAPGAAAGERASLRRRIQVLLAVLVVGSAGVLAALLWQLRADTLASSQKLLTALTQLTEEQTSRTLQNVEQSLGIVDGILAAASLSSALPSTGPDGAAADKIDGQLRKLDEDRPYLAAIRVLDAEGRAIHNSDTGHAGSDFSGQMFFQQHRERETGFHFDPPTRSPATGKWILPATRPLRTESGAFAGVLFAGIDPLFFNRVWAVDGELPKVTVALFHIDGVLMMRSPFVERMMGTSYRDLPLFTSVRAGSRSGNVQIASQIIGEELLLAYRRLTAYPDLVLVVAQPLKQALVAWWQIVWIVVAGWFAAMVAVGVLTVWLMRERRRRHDTQDRYRVLFDANPYPMVVMDPTTRGFFDINDAAVREYGWSRDEAKAMTANDLYSPEDLKAVANIRRSEASGIPEIIKGLHHRRKDGTVFDVEIHARAIEFEGRPAILTMAENVSARQATESQLRQAQKMEAVGQLTGGIAHDFNNILTIILANADALQEEENLAPQLAVRIDQIGQAVQRASGLTHQLLAFSRKQELRPQLTDLNALVAGTGKLLRRALGHHIEIESVLTDGIWTVNVDRGQLETALVNLCINARDAMPEGGKLRIETRNSAFIRREGDIPIGEYALLSVSDTGSGMPPDVVAKVFEPFFTTKGVGKRTGLGLSMVYGFIKQSNGHIVLHSEVGRGTTFLLYLPRSAKLLEDAAAATPEIVPGGRERIMVVEDEVEVLANVVRQLTGLGYAVSQASNGADGLQAFETAKLPFDLLLTDVVMPGGMNGKQLADGVAQRWPKTKIVFMSGFPQDAFGAEGDEKDTGAGPSIRTLGEGVRLLSKPFRKKGLALMVRDALDDGPTGRP